MMDNSTRKIKPDYTVLNKETVDLSSFAKDADGYIILFDGRTLNGWRGYGKDQIPERWVVEDGDMKINKSENTERIDIIFDYRFKNFELILEWKTSKGGNSGIFYLGREVQSVNPETGETKIEPIYVSAPEYQLLDNENHPDALLGKGNNRQSASLYDMIPAIPQNSKPFGEWNKSKIVVNNGKVIHGQNDVDVVRYELWTPEWTQTLQSGKFSEEAWPLAFELLNDCGGALHEGYIGLQDHGDDFWFRNIKIKILS